MDLINLNVKEKLNLLKCGEISCQDNLNFYLAQIEEKNKDYNIFLSISKNSLERAKELDKKRESGEKLGKLFGLCIGVKANISVLGENINCASKTLENYKATFNATVINKILQEDGIIIGITNCDEFASGSSGENSAFGITINPFSPNRIPGGSSSGSAAAISAKMCDLSLGSDTGGSIRNPASHCGVVGIKPSYGRVSRYGLIDLSMSLDQIGPFSKDVYSSSLLLEVISGRDNFDSITFDKDVLNLSKISYDQNKKYKIGFIKNFEKLIEDERISNVFKEKKEKLKNLGHEIIELEIDGIELSIASYYPIVYTEFFSGTRKFDGVKYGKKIEDHCGPEVLRRILGGEEISKSEYEGSYYKKALRVKEILEKEFEKVFEKVDFIISPVTPILPHKFGTKLTPEQMYAYDAFTICANLSGICAGVVSKDIIEENQEKISIGTQIMAKKFGEDKLIEGMYLIENLN
jgi:aspartyl-tRNA(Asn)/glutamyl-tRNA(Gln) amidotransferase subunit A